MSHVLTTDIDVEDNVTPIRRLQPGDVLDVVIKLRELLALCETTAYTLYASFEDVGSKGLEKEAEKTRHTLELATARVAALCSAVEQTPTYVDFRKRTLEERERRR